MQLIYISIYLSISYPVFDHVQVVWILCVYVSVCVCVYRSSRDYGSLACWATNTVGTQADPCLFTVLEAGQAQTLSLYRGTGVSTWDTDIGDWCLYRRTNQ